MMILILALALQEEDGAKLTHGKIEFRKIEADDEGNSETFSTALEEAKKERKPVLIFFT